ncbi:MAG: AmmeMemoRadiSam system protein B [bacterium]|nr:AmmeMemoRadiSam system protein B [bacterium]
MAAGPIRDPAVAGTFFPAAEAELRQVVAGYLTSETQPQKAIGAIMPHAGYIYSGGVAGQTAASVRIPRTVIILGPNHTGMGPAVSVFPGGSWRMPFGDVSVNDGLADQILQRCELANPDQFAHLREHSIEVQLPFLWYARGEELDFVPITVSRLGRDECRILGKALADVISSRTDEILLVASSDMTHYETHQSARAKDSEAISKILDLDPDGLLDTVASRRISMCGIFPTAAMLHAAIALGATGARLVRYATSGEVSGDYEQVVGYAGIIVT